MDVIGERTSHVLGRSPEAAGLRRPGAGHRPGRLPRHRRHRRPRLRVRRPRRAAPCWSRAWARWAAASWSSCTRPAPRLVVADVDPARAKETAERVDAATVDAEAVIGTECDVFAPCATGGVLSAATIPRLRCRVVAGAANNQLAEPQDAELLAGARHPVRARLRRSTPAASCTWPATRRSAGPSEQMAARLAGIGDTLQEIFDAADREGITTDAGGDPPRAVPAGRPRVPARPRSARACTNPRMPKQPRIPMATRQPGVHRRTSACGGSSV